MINIKLLKKLYNKHNIFDIQIKHDVNDNKKNYILNEISSVKFCPDSVKKYLQNCNKNCHIYSNNDNGINFYIYYDDKTIPIMYTLLKAYKQAVIIKKYFNIDKIFDIFIIMTPDKRYISNNEIIDSKHINGGYTSIIDNKIFILRQEEFSKVILHEILHHVIEVDNNMGWNNKHISILKKICNISSNCKLIPNEAIVELWATIFYSLFISFQYNISYINILNIEINHSILQHNKILKKQNNKPWFEYTNAYCYVVLKTIILYNIKNYNSKFTIDEIVNFLIKYKNTIPNNINNEFKKLFETSRGKNSLRMMYLSDY